MAQINLPFEKLLTSQGISELKTLIDQAILNGDVVKLVFEHLKDAQDQPFELPVDVLKTTHYIFKLSVSALEEEKAFFLHQLNSAITELEIKLNLAATTIDELKCKAETELNTIKKKVDDQLAKIPYEVKIQDNNGSNEFFINQTAEIDGYVQGVDLTLKSSSMTFTTASLSQLALNVEAVLPGITDDNGDPHKTSLDIQYGNSKFTGTASNVPLARIQGLKATVDTFTVVIENNEFKAGTQVSGDFEFDFLDQVNGNTATIGYTIALQNDGDVLYEAQNPENHELKKDSVSVFFQQIRILDKNGAPNEVNINGWLQVEGVNQASDGLPVKTTFSFVYADPHFTFTGENFVPVPIGFGEITFDDVLLKIHNNGTLVESKFEGDLKLPTFNDGQLDFTITFIDAADDELKIQVSNPQNNPIKYGDFELKLSQFDMTYINGELNNLEANGELIIPVVTNGQSITVAGSFSKNGNDEEVKLLAQNFGTPELGGCELTFEKLEFKFTNGTFIESDITGRVKIPDTTDGAGIKFDLDITNQGNDYTIALDGNAIDNELNLGPIKLAVDAFTITVANNNLQSVVGNGNMQLPGLDQSFAFAFSVNTAGPDPIYTVTVSNVVANLGGFNLTFNSITVSSQKAQQFNASANGSLKLPVFEDDGAVNFTVAFDRNNNYDITVAAGPEFLKFGDFTLNNLALAINVDNGEVQDFTGNAELQIPGFNSTSSVSVAYTKANTQYSIGIQNALDVDLFGGALHLANFQLVIANDQFDSCTASGTFKLPDSTGGAGIQFTINVSNDGHTYSINLTGTPAQNTLNFGPVELKFSSFKLEVENNDVKSVSGSGELTIPGLSNPFAFSISVDLSGNDPLYIIEILNVTADFESFNLDFDRIRLETKKAQDFDFDIEGNLALPVFDVGQIDFDVAVSENSSYTIEIDGNGQVAKFGDVELRDVEFDLTVDNGNVQNASGTAKLFIPEVTDTNSPFSVSISYAKGANEDFGFTANNLPQVTLGEFELNITTIDALIRNSTLNKFEIEGSSTMPFFDQGGSLEFSFEFNSDGTEYSVELDSTGTLTAGEFEIKDIDLALDVKNKSIDKIEGSAKFKVPGASAFTNVDVEYDGNANTLDFEATSLPQFTISGLTFNFAKFGFGLKNGNLDSTEFDGKVTIPQLDSNHNEVDFEFDFSNSNTYLIEINKGVGETELKIGDVSIFLGSFSMEIVSGELENFGIDAGVQFPAFEQGNSPARINVDYNYTKADTKHSLTLKQNQALEIGGFELTLKELGIAFTPSSLAYPFTFEGDLKIPGLEAEGGGDAVVGVDFQIDSNNDFSASISSDAVFTIGSVKVTINELSLDVENGVYEIGLKGKLELTEFSAMGTEQVVFDVDIEIASDGTFSVLGEATPALKVADIPSVVRIYLSKLGLSRDDSNQWDFTIGGLIQNEIVLPGMDDLLPNELNLNTLTFGNSFDLNMDIKWPSGLSISVGGSQSEAIIPVNGKLGGFVGLDAIKVTFSSDNDGADLGVYFSGASIMLGPLTGIVEGLGIEAKLTKPNFDSNGKPTEDVNFGIVNLDIEFKPPSGVGVSIKTPVFTGGGFLMFDHDKGEYAGAMELSVVDMFAVSAIGVINTKMPDGKPGTSILVIISVEFTPGIALGFGFFISGLGGMLGIHRTMVVEKLREGVREGTLSNIMFPKDIIENVTRIISDIKEFFPVKRDQFIIGPMAAITWGVPTIVRVDLGLAIEFDNPVRFAILGVLRVILPDESAALIKIQVAFLGVLDLDKGMLSFDASLFDSKVLTFGLEGDMVLRISWGQHKDFLISVGGFHPRYSPPTHLQIPSMKRLTLKILSGNPRLTLTTYFAITTNTVQFGAGIDFYFGIAGFKIIGEFGFDVLFQFSPFRFIADARARLAVKAGSATLLSISLEFTLEGPTPWRARGTAKFTILFFTVKANFDTTWGDKRDTTLPDIEVLPLLVEALEDKQNWRAITQSTHIDGMRMAALDPEEEDLVLTPNGTIIVEQKVVPLNTEINKFGQFKPADYTHFTFTDVEIGGDDTSYSYEKDEFAPANFLDIGDNDKLALPSFEQQDSGIIISGNSELDMGIIKDRDVKYEQLVMDEEFTLQMLNPQYKVLGAGTHQFNQQESSFFARSGAVAATGKAVKKNTIVNKNKVVLQQPTYAVVNSDDMSVIDGNANLGFMQAQTAMAQSGANAQIVTQDALIS